MEECVICCEDIEVNTTFTSYCNHNFHHTCLSRWCQYNNSCPSCRAPNIMTLQQPTGTNHNNNTSTNNNNENTNNINVDNIINDYINIIDNYMNNYINNINRNINLNNNNINREYYINNILNYNDI